MKAGCQVGVRVPCPATAKPQPAASRQGPTPAPPTPAHRAWMDRQEAVFTAWVNLVVAPPLVIPSTSSAARLAARTRGWLWSLYQGNPQLQAVMVKVESRIDGGQLRMSSEVSVVCVARGESERGLGQALAGAGKPQDPWDLRRAALPDAAVLDKRVPTPPLCQNYQIFLPFAA